MRERMFLPVLVAALLPMVAMGEPIEPNAGTWKTWVISSGADYRVPPPPGQQESMGEANSMAEQLGTSDAGIRDIVRYWDAGAPSYRWIDTLNARAQAGTPTTAYIHRVYTYVALAMHDATIAAWESKYAYNRPRPSTLDARIKTLVSVPDSPSYPSALLASLIAARMRA